MLDIVIFLILALWIFAIGTLIAQKGFYQKLLCLGLVTNITAVFVIALGSFTYNAPFIDTAIIYMLLGYVLNMAILRIYGGR